MTVWHLAMTGWEYALWLTVYWHNTIWSFQGCPLRPPLVLSVSQSSVTSKQASVSCVPFPFGLSTEPGTDQVTDYTNQMVLLYQVFATAETCVCVWRNSTIGCTVLKLGARRSFVRGKNLRSWAFFLVTTSCSKSANNM